MNFNEALEAMREGKKVKRPHWGGYWFWDAQQATVMMRTKDDEIIDLFDTDRKEYTLTNIASTDFMIADEENTPILGGILTGLSFGKALDIVQRSNKGMRLPTWQRDVVIKCQYPDEHSKMTHPYLYVESRFGRVPWKETVVEMFSNEWEIVD